MHNYIPSTLALIIMLCAGSHLGSLSAPDQCSVSARVWVQAAEHVANTIEAAHPDKPRPSVTTLAKARNDIMVIPTATGDQLVRFSLRLTTPMPAICRGHMHAPVV